MNPATMFGSDLEADAPVGDPLDLLDRWLARVAGDTAAADATTTPLMALATVAADGSPRVRHVLLSSYERGRLHFHTDVRTGKAAELTADPRAAATIVWPEIPRQLSVTGSVVAESPAEQALAFAHRTRYLQLLAWVNDAELARRSTTERRTAWDAYDRDHPTLDPPPTWTGCTLVADRISFWRGAGDGPSQRIVCERAYAGWTIERLPG